MAGTESSLTPAQDALMAGHDEMVARALDGLPAGSFAARSTVLQGELQAATARAFGKALDEGVPRAEALAIVESGLVAVVANFVKTCSAGSDDRELLHQQTALFGVAVAHVLEMARQRPETVHGAPVMLRVPAGGKA